MLLGRQAPPVNRGIATLMEVAETYHSRASEVYGLIQRAEASGRALKNGAHYRFRTGELRTFIEAVKRTIDMGSRRITMAALEYEHEEFPLGD